MTWEAIARNDIRQAVSRRGIWGLFGGLLFGFGGLAALLLYVGEPNFQAYVEIVRAGGGLLVPLAGIILGYDTIIGGRESGTVALVLSFPHSRLSLVVGKLLSKTVILGSTLAAAALLTAVGMVLTYPVFDIPQFSALVVSLAVYGAVFLWLSVALSMALSTSRRVIVAAFGAYIGLTLFWDVLITAVVVILFRFRPPQQPETWATFATFVGPYTAYNYLLGEVANIGPLPEVTLTSTAEFITPAVAILALLGWALLSVGAGYLSFRRRDL